MRKCVLDYLFAITYPSMVCYHNSQQELQLLPQLPAGIAADRKGRRSSDVTVDYIRAPETPTIAFHAGNQDRLLHSWSASFWRRNSHVGFHQFSPLARKLNELSLQK
ncbi:hypothetical protein AMECASPLE_017949 [Ameca splendens]|uniref:Uncharacterized protein n=1 Tax=Ameca splendens TaxID=208324 RepID=A0ABV0ZZJ9_9TELE